MQQLCDSDKERFAGGHGWEKEELSLVKIKIEVMSMFDMSVRNTEMADIETEGDTYSWVSSAHQW